MSLTKTQIGIILDNNSIDECTPSEKKQVFDYAFGPGYMKSTDKGNLKQF